MFNFLYIFIAYLVGSVPTGFLLARAKGINDIRKHGSGNIGATNVARILGKKYFFLIFFLDMGKAFLYLKFLQLVSVNYSTLLFAAAALLLGNAFSLFLQFRGGKGISTSFGILLALKPWLVPSIFGIWFLVFMISRATGTAAIAALILLPFIAWCPCDRPVFILMLFITALCLFLHRDNIRKLMY